MTGMTTKEVAERLRRDPQTIRNYSKSGVLVGVPTSGQNGNGHWLYFDPGEVEAFAAGGVLGAALYRERKAKKRARKPAGARP